jgi:hypothetical protein
MISHIPTENTQVAASGAARAYETFSKLRELLPPDDGVP